MKIQYFLELCPFRHIAIFFEELIILKGKLCLQQQTKYECSICLMPPRRTSCIKGTWFVRLTPPKVLELQL
jgi:hypothetical protein